ncbi:hypothetical protein [Paludibacter sp.]|uniref:hypothetical protein n=1 Tax=Paludibacter sp. TaxID=1898105 RepID=UPI001354AF80|nr:hypothetical protein [Paludibacter sp.]MTK52692.1 hypothetical protein [Paludibacter sp.]
MERRDYLEKEIEKMRAVLQKILRLRVDKEEEVREIISTELLHYFNITLPQLQQMSENDFECFIQGKNTSLLEYLGNLLYASTLPEAPLSDMDRLSLKKAIFVWNMWEHKTKTFDPEQQAIKNKVLALLNESSTEL